MQYFVQFPAGPHFLLFWISCIRDLELWLTNDILLEYEEKISIIFSKEVAELITGALILLPLIPVQTLSFVNKLQCFSAALGEL